MSVKGPSPSARLAALFEQHQGVTVPRTQVQQVGSQLDPLKRLRRNGGARDILDRKGIALLWGKGDRGAIVTLGLGPVLDDEFISYTPQTKAELSMLRQNGHAALHAPPGV